MNAAAVIGGYRLLGLLGRGASGAVHLALDPQSHSEVALKVLALPEGLPPAESRELRQRFEREAAVARRLNHPHIVALLASGHDEDVAWMAMERVHGVALTAYCQPARLLPIPQVVTLLLALLDALAHAHGQGILHRDIKPANVLVNLPQGLIKLADFGLAWLDDAARTRTGVSLGSPAYMSPQLLAGGAPDAGTDLYALGVMGYELLSGRLPFQGATLGALLRSVMTSTAPPLAQLRPEVPAALAHGIEALMQRQADLRPRDARQAQQALRRSVE